MPRANAEHIVAELRAFFQTYVEALTKCSLEPGDEWTNPEIVLAKRFRIRRTMPPIHYDPLFGPPTVAAVGNVVVVAHDALRAWGVVAPFLAAVGRRPRHLDGLSPIVVARISCSSASARARELEDWLACLPRSKVRSEIPPPWLNHPVSTEDVHAERPTPHSLIVSLPLAPGHVDAFVQWNERAGHEFELHLATDEELGRPRSLRRALRERFFEYVPPEDAIRPLVERLRVAARHVPSAKPWPNTHREAWIERFASHLERTFPDITPSKLKPEHFGNLDLIATLEAELSPEQMEQLDREVPVAVEMAPALGSGMRRVRYPRVHCGEVDLPILESLRVERIPRCAVPIQVRLLVPSGRCVAVTDDLRYFWSVMYNDWLRDGLVSEFPKIAWPPVGARG